jgi:hypothetical protein
MEDSLAELFRAISMMNIESPCPPATEGILATKTETYHVEHFCRHIGSGDGVPLSAACFIFLSCERLLSTPFIGNGEVSLCESISAKMT